MPNTPDPHRLLNQAEIQCKIARDALKDEREGDFTQAILLLNSDAQKLADLIASW